MDAQRTYPVEAGEKYLLIEEVAERLRASVKWVRKMVHQKKIPCVRFNERVWRFHWPSVQAALNKLN